MLLGGVTLPDGATQLVGQEGEAQFLSPGTVTHVQEFYVASLAGEGWEAVSTALSSPEILLEAFVRDREYLFITSVQTAAGAWTKVSRVSPPAAEVGPLSPAEVAARVMDSLNLTLGACPGGSVLPGFHLEASGITPMLDASSGRISELAFRLEADVEGSEVHLTYAGSKGGGSESEGTLRKRARCELWTARSNPRCSRSACLD